MESQVKAASNNIPVVIGILTQTDDGKKIPIRLSLVEKQVQSINTESYAGVSIFFYGSLWNPTPLAPRETVAGRKADLTRVLQAFGQL